jgi:hypothetical protein
MTQRGSQITQGWTKRDLLSSLNKCRGRGQVPRERETDDAAKTVPKLPPRQWMIRVFLQARIGDLFHPRMLSEKPRDL